jgi:hypothetical protein
LFLLVAVVVILGNVITIGEKMTKVFGTPYLEYGFYLLLFVVLLWLVAYPMYRIHSAPEFPVLSVEANGGDATGQTDDGKPLVAKDDWKRLLSFAHRISGNCYYLPERYRPIHEQELRQQLADIRKQQDFDALKAFVQKEVDVLTAEMNGLMSAWNYKRQAAMFRAQAEGARNSAKIYRHAAPVVGGLYAGSALASLIGGAMGG